MPAAGAWPSSGRGPSLGRAERPARKPAGSQLQQGDAQHIAHQQLRAAYRHGVEKKRTGKGGGKPGLRPGQQRAHNQPVADHRGQRGQPLVFAPGGQQSGNQSRQGAEDQIRQAVGAEDVGQDTSGEEAPGGGGTKEWENGEGFGEAALEDAECKAEEIAEVAEGDVERTRPSFSLAISS